jgi:hypothetical protein
MKDLFLGVLILRVCSAILMLHLFPLSLAFPPEHAGSQIRPLVQS